METTTILVAGATGLLGNEICRLLRAKNLPVKAIVRTTSDPVKTEQLTKLGLNDRQIKAVLLVKEKGKITNNEYQILNEISDRTALRDLEELTEKSILIKEGEKKGTSYKLNVGG